MDPVDDEFAKKMVEKAIQIENYRLDEYMRTIC
jgi:hypothetical protein